MTKADAYRETLTMHGEAFHKQQDLESTAHQFGRTGLGELGREGGWCAFDSFTVTEHLNQLRMDGRQFNHGDWFFYRGNMSAKPP